MDGEHTTGKLRIYQESQIVNEHGSRLRLPHGSVHLNDGWTDFTADEARINARRLVAAWNVTRDLDVAQLEGLGDGAMSGLVAACRDARQRIEIVSRLVDSPVERVECRALANALGVALARFDGAGEAGGEASRG